MPLWVGIMLPRIEDVLPDDAIAAPVAKYIVSTCTPRKAAWPVMYAAMKNSAGAATCLLCKAHDTNGAQNHDQYQIPEKPQHEVVGVAAAGQVHVTGQYLRNGEGE